MNWTASDFSLMGQALSLATKGLYTSDPNPRVGCVLARNGTILGCGWHMWAGEAHAEIHALSQVDDARGSTCYVNLEPCSHQGRTPPCTDALIEAGVCQVHAGMHDPNPAVAGRGLEQLEQAGINTSCGLLSAPARKLNRGFISRMERKRPWLCAKLATSLDGRMALSNGRSQWITSASARHDGHRLRAAHSAIITGVNTILYDDPELTVREIEHPVNSPLPVILDSKLRTPTNARILSGKSCLICTCSDNAEKIQQLTAAGSRICQLPEDANGHVDLNACLRHLAVEEQINTVLVEAGGTLCGAFIDANLVDELVIYMSSCLLGDKAQPMFRLREILELEHCPHLQITDVRHIGNDLRISAETVHTGDV